MLDSQTVHLWVFCTHECWHFCLRFAFGKGEGTVIDYPDISVAFWQEISDDGFCSLAWWHTSCLMSSIKWCWEVTVCLNPPGNQREPVALFAVATLGLRVVPGCFFCLFPLAWICPKQRSATQRWQHVLTKIYCMVVTRYASIIFFLVVIWWNMLDNNLLMRSHEFLKEPYAFYIILSRWWFQIFFMFTPIWGRFPFWLILFTWLETTN